MSSRAGSTLQRTASVAIDADLKAEAERLSVDLSRAAEAGISAAVRSESARRWVEDNRDALESWNEWTKEEGIPLSQYRQF
jgi:antitoxin CcdA